MADSTAKPKPKPKPTSTLSKRAMPKAAAFKQHAKLWDAINTFVTKERRLGRVAPRDG